MKKRIGLIGIGLVGYSLANNLIEAGYEVHGFDLSVERIQAFEDIGGIGEDSGKAVGTVCETVLLSVRDSKAVRDVVEGIDGLMFPETKVHHIIDTTTGDPEDTVLLAKRLAQKQVGYLDATISGSSEQVRLRQAVFLVGGAIEDYHACRPIIESLCNEMFYLGPSGAGAKTKLASNLILGLNRLALAEGLLFAECLGLDLTKFLEVIRHTPAYSAAIDAKGKKMITNDFSPQSKISQHRKDLDIILAYKQRSAQVLPLTEIHHRILKLAEREGLSDADTSAVIEQLRRMKK